MRKVEQSGNWQLPETRKIDFTKEELLDILDFYLQYKPMLDEYIINKNNYPQFDPHDFTILLYMYGIIDTNYLKNLDKISEKYGKENIHDLSKEKLDFLEIMTIFTFIHRADRHAGEWYEDCIEYNTYYNLLCRLEEINNELESE